MPKRSLGPRRQVCLPTIEGFGWNVVAGEECRSTTSISNTPPPTSWDSGTANPKTRGTFQRDSWITGRRLSTTMWEHHQSNPQEDAQQQVLDPGEERVEGHLRVRSIRIDSPTTDPRACRRSVLRPGQHRNDALRHTWEAMRFGLALRAGRSRSSTEVLQQAASSAWCRRERTTKRD